MSNARQPLCASSPAPFLLQRQRCDGDCGKWRTVLRVTAQQMADVETLVGLAGRLDPCVVWRLAALPDA